MIRYNKLRSGVMPAAKPHRKTRTRHCYLDGVTVGVTVPVTGIGVCVGISVAVGIGVDVGNGVTVPGCPTKPGVGVSRLPSIGYPSEYHLGRPPSNTETVVKPKPYKYIAAARLIDSLGD